ncbi:site-specific integrase [Selenomonas ruminantium]|uniref:tyrosine-type recombinase/integrase n=1 Tax=Selenomonas ruminantium TaxID=971 RepID=UPI0026F328CC|nr:site-specific integrase [Selenomonas ruminantium]
MKLKDYMTYWYRTYRMPHQQKNTQTSCKSLIRNHIFTSNLANMDLCDITVRDCQEFLTNELLYGGRGRYFKKKEKTEEKNPLSRHSVKKLRQLLIAMFRQAVKEDMASKNVAENTEPVALLKKDVPVFTPEMQKKFLQATKNHRFYTAYVMLFFLGCRRSELLGLSWDSIDFRRNILKINQVLIIEDNQVVLQKRTKTDASIRAIPFPQEIKYMLQEWKIKQKEEAKADGYSNQHNLVFVNKDGSPHNPTYFSRNFKNTIRRLDFLSNDLHLHSTRHTWATNMIQCGIAITDIQAIGGWSRPDTLLNIYAHTVKESQRKAMKKLYKELQ